MILVPANKVEKIKYFSTLLGLIFIEITRGLFDIFESVQDIKYGSIPLTCSENYILAQLLLNI